MESCQINEIRITLACSQAALRASAEAWTFCARQLRSVTGETFRRRWQARSVTGETFRRRWQARNDAREPFQRRWKASRGAPEPRGAEVLSYEHPFGVGYLVAVLHDGGDAPVLPVVLYNGEKVKMSQQVSIAGVTRDAGDRTLDLQGG